MTHNEAGRQAFHQLNPAVELGYETSRICARSPAKPRAPASIFHEDGRLLADVTSEMLRHYRPHDRQSHDDEDYYDKYRATTYKRHADPRFKVHLYTHRQSWSCALTDAVQLIFKTQKTKFQQTRSMLE